MDDKTLYGPEVRTRCLIKFHISNPQVKMGPERGEGHKVGGLLVSRRMRNKRQNGVRNIRMDKNGL